MNDRENSDAHNNQEPQAPKFMRPRRPVLDEPLEEADGDTHQEVEARQPDIEKIQTAEQLSLEATQELKPEPETPEQTGQAADPEASPELGEMNSTEIAVHSPYFPRGIYEDARSVEAYYGRGAAEVEAAQMPEKGIEPGKASTGSLARWLILVFAILMILVLLFLTLTQGIPLGFF